ncbi:MAG: J domain-containing protein [Myxococcota bacterium]
MTHYETLDIPPDAPIEEIVRAYRKLALETHPDHVPVELSELRTAAEERFATLTAAFAVLSDPAARRRYDAELHDEGSTIHARSESRRWLFRRRERSRREGSAQGRPRPIEAFVKQRRAALKRKRTLLLIAGLIACLAPLIAVSWGSVQAIAHRLWWRTSSPLASTAGWYVDALRFYPVTESEKARAPEAKITMRGYVKGLDGCYVIPARGKVIEESPDVATIRIEMQRSGPWNSSESYMGSCSPNFAAIEAHLPAPDPPWARIDVIAVDTDVDLSRRFASPVVEWQLNRRQRKP